MSHEDNAPAATDAQADLSPGDRMELYKITVEMADRISARRGIANSFFLTLHTALIASLALLERGSTHTEDRVGRVVVHSETVQPVDPFYVGAVAVAGIVLAVAWWLLLRSYRDLNKEKFKVIHRLESRWEVQPFAEEWVLAKSEDKKGWERWYAEFGNVERVVPVAFSLIYIAVLVRLA